MFDKFRQTAAVSRLLEEKFYEQVIEELANGDRRNGLWAKALANSNGIEDKAKSLYLQYRVRSIKDEIEISEKIKKETLDSETQLDKKGRKRNYSKDSTNKDEELISVPSPVIMFLIPGLLLLVIIIASIFNFV